jgi:serine protease Do
MKTLSLFVLLSLLTSAPLLAQKKIWSEKSANSPFLVNMPSIQPIIREIDSAVVFINSTVSGKKGRDNNGGPRQRGPLSPEDFFERFFEQMPQNQMPRRSSGSGFIISQDGYIITNNHVIEGAEKIEVSISRFDEKTKKTSKQDTLTAEIVGRDPRTDLALIKIKPTKELTVAPLGDSDALVKGDWVVAIGNPFGLEHSVSVGIVSAKEREISPNENRRFDDFIQTDAAINFGNSGGPLVNLKGEVVGINTAITAQGSGIGFAVPINLAKALIPQLMEKGTVARGYLGVMIQDVTAEMKDAMGLEVSEGVLVNGVAPDGPAVKSDLKAGDVILQVNDQKTPDAKSLQRVIGARAPGDTVSLQVLRDKKRREVKIKLGSLDQPQTSKAPKADDSADLLGLMVEPGPGGAGVVVTDLDEESVAAQSGIRPGDRLIQIAHQGKRSNISSLKDYREVVSKLKPNDSVVLQIERGDEKESVRSFIAFRVPPKGSN